MPSQRLWSVSVRVVPTVALLLALGTKSLLDAPRRSSNSPALHLPVSDYTPERLAQAVAQRQPVILRNSPASKWPAISKWTPAYLKDTIPRFKSVYTSSKPDFLYYYTTIATDEHVRRSRALGVPFHADFLAMPMDSKTFFHICGNRTSATYVYLSARIRDLGQGNALLQDDIRVDAIVPQEMNASGNGKAPTVQLWAGKRGVHALPHYDSSHNLYLHVWGAKRFTLAPPSAYTTCRLYPLLHPHSRQCQDPSTVLPASISVSLSPGDLMYIPPYWFHEAVSESTSISLSTWTDSEEMEVYDAIQKIDLPFDAAWTVPKKSEGVRLLLEQSFGEDRIRSLMEERYGFHVPVLLGGDDRAAEYRLLNATEQSHIRNRSLEYRAAFGRFRDMGVRGIKSHDYMETVISWAGGWTDYEFPRRFLEQLV